jgi:hypothetical protein
MSMGVSRHDDLVDAMSYAEQIIQPYVTFGKENAHIEGESFGYQKDYGL